MGTNVHLSLNAGQLTFYIVSLINIIFRQQVIGVWKIVGLRRHEASETISDGENWCT